MQIDSPSDMKSLTLEKSVKQLEDIVASPSRTQSSIQEDEPFDAIDEKRLIRRIDFTLLPWLTVLYILCFLDRVSIGNARLYGMEADLNISDTQYLIALSLFFVSYALLEMPSNLVIKRMRPSIWLSTIMLLWGITTTCLGLAENFAGLTSLRILLGVFEAGFYPGVVFYLTCWYKRDELGFRFALFHTSMSCAGAFGGLLAAAISNMDGVGGKGAWAWIFIVEGLATVIAGVVSYFLIHDFPDSAGFISERERKFVIRRLQIDGQFSAGGEKLQWKNVWRSVLDYKTWLAAMCLIGFAGPMYAFALFLPSIIRELGYTATRANLLSVPVYFAGGIVSLITNYVADRLRKRGSMLMTCNIITGAGFIVLLCSRKPALSYIATYVAAIGIVPGGSNMVTWISNNVEGSYKRSVTIALMTTCANLTGIITSNTYRHRDTPWYTLGHAVTFGYVVIGFTGSVSMFFLLRRENARRDRGERDEVIGDSKVGDPKNGVYESVEEAKMDKGDQWSGFRYIT